jgi:NTP pyrophosphatase (non-canonical NTP hydrolase)
MQLSDIYNMQCVNQQLLIDNGKYDGVTRMSLPNDNVSLSSYHIQQLVSEIGEVLAADKRWKNLRNDKYDSENKLEEIADCFIVLMNIAIFSGIGAEALEKAIVDKLNVVNARFKESIK